MEKTTCEIIEQWKPVLCAEGYLVSNLGEVMDLHEHRPVKVYRCGKDNLYRGVNLRCRDGKVRPFRVHRIVAEAFCPNDSPEDKTEVDHINEAKHDNRATNLRWVTPRENKALYWANHPERRTAVYLVRLDGTVVKVYPSLVAASIAEGLTDEAVARRIASSYYEDGFAWLADPAALPNVLPPATDGEEWKPITRRDGYFVSSCGRVWSCYSKKLLGIEEHNGRLYFSMNGVGASVAIEVLRAFSPSDNPHMKPCWKDGDMKNNNLSNLCWRKPKGWKRKELIPPADKENWIEIVDGRYYINRQRQLWSCLKGGIVRNGYVMGEPYNQFMDRMLGREKPVIVYTEGETRHEFRTLRSAAAATGMTVGQIYHRLHRHGESQWSYAGGGLKGSGDVITDHTPSHENTSMASRVVFKKK